LSPERVSARNKKEEKGRLNILFLDPAKSMAIQRRSGQFSTSVAPLRALIGHTGDSSDIERTQRRQTTTSLNLAVSLAQMEKVLLIDADMRRPFDWERRWVFPQ
jgi:hypothetical protein